MIGTDVKQLSAAHRIRSLARERILVLDGAMGTMIQARQFDEAAFRGARFADFHRDLRGNNDLLILTQPQAIEASEGGDILEAEPEKAAEATDTTDEGKA